jgi:hypothetical protein
VCKREGKREMIERTIGKHVKFGYILADSWFSSVENIRFIGKERKKGRFVRIVRMGIPDGELVPVYIKGLRFPVILYKQVFKNKDWTVGVRYPVTNEGTMTGDRFKTLYKKRWSIEVYYESIKQNVSIGDSPARTKRTQSNHIFASIYGYVKLELARVNHGCNHFAMKSMIYPASLKWAIELLSTFNMGDNGTLA